ncbi:helix-turn-helix domain-containing protein [Streptomyces sp. NPDC015232]|uniref:helix-turn-helix domain-containing protein n=1 Tax=unclassified Streptomyces TaxID=2593676 RepID=UPI0036FBCD4F
MGRMLEQPIFGRRLRELRLERGLSQAALAGHEISTGYLSRLESGARPPTDRVVAYLAERLGVPASTFAEVETGSLAHVLARVTSSPDRSDEAATALADALAAAGDHSPALRWQALWLLTRIRSRSGQYAEELDHLRELTRLADELDMPELRTRARTQTARCMRALGDNEQAYAFSAEAFRIARQHDLSTRDTATALLAVVSAEAEAGRLSDARAHADELCALVKDASGTLPVEAAWAAATVRMRQGDLTGAQDLLEQALQELDSHDDLMLWMRLRLAAASLYLQVEPARTDAASLRLQEAETALGLVGTPLHQQERAALRAHLAFRQGRTADARALCERLAEEELLLSFRDRVRLDVLRCQILATEGRPEEAVDTLRTLAREANESLNTDLAAEVWRTLAETLARLQNPGV